MVAKIRRGFTLLEMLIVIAIMLILVIATLPRIRTALDESKLREGSRQLNSYFSMAKARAATTGRPCGVMFIPERVGDPSQNPGTFHTSQLYLSEVPAPYAGDFTESGVVVTDLNGDNWGRSRKMLGPPWRLNFTPAGSAGGLLTLVADGENFGINIGDKSSIGWLGYRQGNTFFLSGLTSPPTGTLTPPPTATSDYTDSAGVFHPDPGYKYKVVRNAVRIGQALNLPRGTAVDLSYSGFGNAGAEFFSSAAPVQVLFGADGRVVNVSYSAWNGSTSSYQAISDEARGTVHFLIGRPEKTGLALPQSNLWDNSALWVSVGRLTGSIVTTENAADVNLPYATAAQQQAFLAAAREFAISQDVKSGR